MRAVTLLNALRQRAIDFSRTLPLRKAKVQERSAPERVLLSARPLIIATLSTPTMPATMTQSFGCFVAQTNLAGRVAHDLFWLSKINPPRATKNASAPSAAVGGAQCADGLWLCGHHHHGLSAGGHTTTHHR